MGWWKLAQVLMYVWMVFCKVCQMTHMKKLKVAAFLRKLIFRDLGLANQFLTARAPSMVVRHNKKIDWSLGYGLP